MKHLTTNAALLLTILTLVAGLPNVAEAGDRELQVLLVQVGGQTDAEDDCFRQIRRAVTDGYTEVTWASDERVAEQFGLDISDFLVQWFDYPDESFSSAMNAIESDDEHFDAMILIQCQPETWLVRIVVKAPSGVFRFRVESVPIDGEFGQQLGELILRHGWIGFVP